MNWPFNDNVTFKFLCFNRTLVFMIHLNNVEFCFKHFLPKHTDNVYNISTQNLLPVCNTKDKYMCFIYIGFHISNMNGYSKNCLHSFTISTQLHFVLHNIKMLHHNFKS